MMIEIALLWSVFCITMLKNGNYSGKMKTLSLDDNCYILILPISFREMSFFQNYPSSICKHIHGLKLSLCLGKKNNLKKLFFTFYFFLLPGYTFDIIKLQVSGLSPGQAIILFPLYKKLCSTTQSVSPSRCFKSQCFKARPCGVVPIDKTLCLFSTNVFEMGTSILLTYLRFQLPSLLSNPEFSHQTLSP